jgi:hypothetical protein
MVRINQRDSLRECRCDHHPAGPSGVHVNYVGVELSYPLHRRAASCCQRPELTRLIGCDLRIDNHIHARRAQRGHREDFRCAENTDPVSRVQLSQCQRLDVTLHSRDSVVAENMEYVHWDLLAIGEFGRSSKGWRAAN